ncbi:MAG: AMP-binding protein [Saprospiraceae bacterium]|nr:AMP-binding protein [Saprospiraceae bacterium]
MGHGGTSHTRSRAHLENINENGEGEIWVRGPNLMQGYFKKPALTQAVINQDGWLQTGDIGRLIESKYVQITDRIKDLSKPPQANTLLRHLCSYILQDPFI